jgi:hypothetical protein
VTTYHRGSNMVVEMSFILKYLFFKVLVVMLAFHRNIFYSNCLFSFFYDCYLKKKALRRKH